MLKLDEARLRRADFVPGSAVVLADGQEWQLRRPVVRFLPDDSTGSGFQSCLILGDDRDEFHALVKARDALFGGGATAPILKLAGPELKIGRAMLAANYDLTADQVRTLLQFAYDAEQDPVGAGIRDAVMEVAEGLGPKPGAGGDGSSPTPPAD